MGPWVFPMGPSNGSFLMGPNIRKEDLITSIELEQAEFCPSNMLIQSGTKWYKVVQSATKWYKVVQSGTKCYKVLQNY